MAFWRALLRLKTGSTSWQGSVAWLSALDILTSWWWAAKVMINSYMHGFLKSIAETQDRINQLTGQCCMIECSWHLDILTMSCQSDDKLLHAWLSEEHCWDSRQDQPADGQCCMIECSWHLDILMMSCQSDDKLLHAWLSEEHCWDSRQDQPADGQCCMIECSWHLDILMMSCQSDDKLLHAWLSEEHCWDSRQDQPADMAVCPCTGLCSFDIYAYLGQLWGPSPILFLLVLCGPRCEKQYCTISVFEMCVQVPPPPIGWPGGKV